MNTFDELDINIMTHAEWVFDSLKNAENETERAFYQGQVEGLAQVRRIMARLEKINA